MKSLVFSDYTFVIPTKGTVVVRGSLAPTESLFISGISGVGKTTLLRTIAGLRIENESGSLKLFERECVGQWSRDLAMVFQGPQLFSHLNVFENLLIAFERVDSLRSLSLELKSERILKILERVDLLDKRETLAADLSGGEHQRAAICRALLSEAPLLLLDEPYSALDELSVVRVNTALKEYVEMKNASLVVVSHKRQDFWNENVKVLDWKAGSSCLEF